MMRGMGGGINLTPVSFSLETHSPRPSFCETSIKFLPHFCMDRDIGEEILAKHIFSNPKQPVGGI
jgi:hypothetical protein